MKGPIALGLEPTVILLDVWSSFGLGLAVAGTS